MTTYEFDVDTRSEPIAPGTYETTVTDRWNTPILTPNGGYLLALMLRGLQSSMPLPDPVVAAVTYVTAAVPGPATMEASVLKSGRRLATGRLTLRQGGEGIAHLLASFRDRASAHGRTAEFGTPPALPPPDQCRALDRGPGFAGVTLADRVEYRFAQAPGWASGEPSGRPETDYWVRFADGRPVDLIALAFLVDAFPPAVLEIGERAAVTVQLTVHLHRVPATPWVACALRTTHLVDGYHEEDMELWDESGNLLAQSRQLALLV